MNLFLIFGDAPIIILSFLLFLWNWVVIIDNYFDEHFYVCTFLFRDLENSKMIIILSSLHSHYHNLHDPSRLYRTNGHKRNRDRFSSHRASTDFLFEWRPISTRNQLINYDRSSFELFWDRKKFSFICHGSSRRLVICIWSFKKSHLQEYLFCNDSIEESDLYR